MRIRPICKGLILLAVALGICGCERNEKAGLSLWHIMHYSGPKEVLQDAVDRFEEENPGMPVEVSPIQNDAFKTKLHIEMASGSPPDIFHTWGGGKLAYYAKAGMLLDLTGYLEQDGWGDRFSPRALDFCRVDGRIYAVPLDLSAVVLWYNGKLFAEHGLEPPATWQALLSLCRTLRQEKIIPLALGNRKQWPGAFYFIYLANRLGGTELFEGAALRKPGVSFADPAFVEAGRKVRELVEIKAFPEGFDGLSDAEARRLFFNGRAAMMLTGTWLVARCKTDAPNLMPHLRCAPFPKLSEGRGDPATVVGGTNAAFAVTSKCAHPETAVELLRFLTAPHTVREWARIGRLPAVRSVGDVDLPEPTRQAVRLLRQSARIQLYYDQYLTPALALTHKETTQAIFAGVLSPEAAAQKMEAAAGELSD